MEDIDAILYQAMMYFFRISLASIKISRPKKDENKNFQRTIYSNYIYSCFETFIYSLYAFKLKSFTLKKERLYVCTVYISFFFKFSQNILLHVMIYSKKHKCCRNVNINITHVFISKSNL